MPERSSTHTMSASAVRFSRLVTATVLVTIGCDNGTTTPPSATSLAFTTQPTNAFAGTLILPAVAAAIQDETGRSVTTSSAPVTLSIASGSPGAQLLGNTTVAAVNGVAVFPNLRIKLAGAGYTLVASSPNLTPATSAAFTVMPAFADRLGFVIQPVTTIAHVTIPDVSVAVQDSVGNRISGAVNAISLSLNPEGGLLYGARLAIPLDGIAVFSGLGVANPGSGYRLVAYSSGLMSATSAAFDVTIGAASKLGFITHPSTAAPGAMLSPAVVVAVQDIGGNTVPTATNTVTVALGTNAGNGTLSGVTTAVAINGLATFETLSINNPGSGYTLTATAPNLTGATSRLFSIRNPIVFAAVTAGYFHTCGLSVEGSAYCWGENANGQLGNGSLLPSYAPELVQGGLAFANVGAGRTHTCGVTNGGAAYCWGNNETGRLGTGGPQSPIPAAVSGGLTFGAATAGYAHTCGVTNEGTGYCWGENSTGSVGDGSQIQKSVPTAVSGGLTFASISPGRWFSCGLTTSGAPYCWGENGTGELGDGQTIQRLFPVAVLGQLTFTTVSAGGFHACGLTPGGAAYCWGWNQYGQLGNGSTLASSTPVAVSGALTFAILSAGNRHTCGVTSAGVAYCWGENFDGNLGNGTTVNSLIPVAVSGGLVFKSVSAGRFHTCGVTVGGGAYCWGANANGELGDGTTIGRLVPVPAR